MFRISPRFEFRDGYQKLQTEDAVPAFLITQRTRFSLAYESERSKIKVSHRYQELGRRAALFANMTAVYGDHASLDMFEGYVEAKVKNNAWVSVGRQQLIYDNEWLLAARNWNQNGNQSLHLYIRQNQWI